MSRFTLLYLALMTLGSFAIGGGRGTSNNSGADVLQKSASSEDASSIEAGKTIGQIALGDTREKILQNYPLPRGMDQEYNYSAPPCVPRTEIEIVHLSLVVFLREAGSRAPLPNRRGYHERFVS
jgi:hypothetical protein